MILNVCRCTGGIPQARGYSYAEMRRQKALLKRKRNDMRVSEWLDEQEAQGLDVSGIDLPTELLFEDRPDETIFFENQPLRHSLREESSLFNRRAIRGLVLQPGAGQKGDSSFLGGGLEAFYPGPVPGPENRQKAY